MAGAWVHQPRPTRDARVHVHLGIEKQLQPHQGSVFGQKLAALQHIRGVPRVEALRILGAARTQQQLHHRRHEARRRILHREAHRIIAVVAGRRLGDRRMQRMTCTNQGLGALRGHQWSSVAIRGHQRPSVVISGHQWSSVAIRGHQRSSVAISGHLHEARTQRPPPRLGWQRPSVESSGGIRR